MFKLSLRQMASHKIRFLMTSLAVVLGVMFVVGSLVVTDTLRQSFDTLFAEINEGIDLEVRAVSEFDDGPGQVSREPIPADVLETVSSVEGVDVAEGGVGGYAQPVAPDGEPVSTMGAPLLGFSWGPTDALYPVSLEMGEKPDEAGEVAIDQGTFEEYEFELGEQVEVLLTDGTQTFTLVGTAVFGETNSLAGARLTLFETDQAQQAFDREGVYDVIDVRVEPGADVREVQAAISQELPPDVEVVTGEMIAEEGSDEVAQFASVFGNVLLGFAGVILFVAGFYIYNTFSIILGQRVRELALLRAIGASAAQIRATVILEAIVVGLVASVLGIGLGMLTAAGIRGLLNTQGLGLPADSLVLEPATVVAAFVVGLGVTLLSAVLPARKAASIPPVAALTEGLTLTAGSRRVRLAVGTVMSVVGAVLLVYGLFLAEGAVPVLVGLGPGAVLVFLGVANLSPLIAGPVARAIGAIVARVFRTPGKLARENASRNPFRTASTASALMIGLALVTMASIVGTSVKETFASVIEQTVNADFVISEDSFAGFSPSLADQVAAREEFDAVTGVRFGQFRFEGAEKSVVAVDAADAAELVDIDLQQGTGPASLDTTSLLIHEDPAEDLGLSPGEQVSVEFSRTGEQNFTVAGVYGDATFAGNYLISTEAWDQHFTDQLDQFVFAHTAEGVEPGEAAAAMQEATAAFPQVTVEDRQEFLASQQEQVDQVLVIINVLLLLAVVIAVLGIANTLALSVFERTRELGLLRAVGMSRRQIRRMVRWESAIVSVFGAVLGVSIGVVFGVAAVVALPETAASQIAVPTGTLVGLVVLAMFAGLLAAIFPARRASKLDVLTAIATE